MPVERRTGARCAYHRLRLLIFGHGQARREATTAKQTTCDPVRSAKNKRKTTTKKTLGNGMEILCAPQKKWGTHIYTQYNGSPHDVGLFAQRRRTHTHTHTKVGFMHQFCSQSVGSKMPDARTEPDLTCAKFFSSSSAGFFFFCSFFFFVFRTAKELSRTHAHTPHGFASVCHGKRISRANGGRIRLTLCTRAWTHDGWLMENFPQ